jgi:hypothetical protein
MKVDINKISEPRGFPKVVAGSERQYSEARCELVANYIYLVVLGSIIIVRVALSANLLEEIGYPDVRKSKL